MARVASNNFLTIEGWMRTDLGIAGNELIVYAVIYQFSQGQAGRYIGGLPYLADWCGCHIDTARRTIRSLENRGLITALRGEVNGVPYCNYTVCDGPLHFARVSPQNATDTPANCKGDPRKMQGITINELEDRPEVVSTTARARDFDFRSALIDIGVSAEAADAWMAVRRKARAVNSEIAFRYVAREIAKAGEAGYTPDACIRKAAAKSWRGFEAAWMLPKESAPRRGQAPRRESVYQHNERVLNEFMARPVEPETPDEQ